MRVGGPDAEFGALLRRYRLSIGLTQEALAQRAGVSASAVSDIERGLHQAPQRETALRLIEALGLIDAERQSLRSSRDPIGKRAQHRAP
jgi:transcriptional regulator with XRE-family HTH domain